MAPPAEGDLTLHGEIGFIQMAKFNLPDVRFDEVAGVTSYGTGGGAGKVRFADN
jgi:hypothetical protein